MMELFEHLFHVNIDNGSGALELLWLVLFISVIIGVALKARTR